MKTAKVGNDMFVLVCMNPKGLKSIFADMKQLGEEDQKALQKEMDDAFDNLDENLERLRNQ